jgi:hypothetical protein
LYTDLNIGRKEKVDGVITGEVVWVVLVAVFSPLVLEVDVLKEMLVDDVADLAGYRQKVVDGSHL